MAANPFDQFDAPVAAPASGSQVANPFNGKSYVYVDETGGGQSAPDLPRVEVAGTANSPKAAAAPAANPFDQFDKPLVDQIPTGGVTAPPATSAAAPDTSKDNLLEKVMGTLATR